MKLLKSNPQIANNEIEGINLISNSLLSIFIYNEGGTVNINAKIRNIYNNEILIMKFMKVLEYNFYYNNKYLFYNIETYKVLKDCNNNYYLSFDPDESVDNISTNDQDFILAGELVIFIE